MLVLEYTLIFFNLKYCDIYYKYKYMSKRWFYIFREWHFGSFYCNFNQFISLCSVPASVLTMLAMTLDRRRAIMSPLKPRTTKLMVLLILAVIWVLSATLAVPPAFNSSTISLNNRSEIYSLTSQTKYKRKYVLHLNITSLSLICSWQTFNVLWFVGNFEI